MLTTLGLDVLEQSADILRLRAVLERLLVGPLSDSSHGLSRLWASRRDRIVDCLDQALPACLLEHLGGDSDALQVPCDLLIGLFTEYMAQWRGPDAAPASDAASGLWWAASDAYFVKTTEQHSEAVVQLDPTDILESPRLVFKLNRAESDADNNKSADQRRYVLRGSDPVEVDGQVLTCWFDYTGDGQHPAQKVLNQRIEQDILRQVNGDWRAALERPRGRKQTVLGAELKSYTRRTLHDLMIHRHLGTALTAELTRRVETQILGAHLMNAPDGAERAIGQARAACAAGALIIGFLDEIETLAKGLFLKKKLVRSQYWVGTTDILTQGLTESEKTAHQPWWTQLGLVEAPATQQTELFSAIDDVVRPFRSDLLEDPAALTSRIDQDAVTVRGQLVQADCLHGLRLLKDRLQGRLGVIYIDPPYNARTDETRYRNTYDHGAWLSFMRDRLDLAKELMTDEVALIVAIDENEQERLGLLLEQMFPHHKRVCVSVVHNPRGIQGGNFSYCHEYAYFVFPDRSGFVNTIPVPKAEWEFQNLRKWGNVSTRDTAKNCFYPIFVTGDEIVGAGAVAESDYHPTSRCEANPDGTTAVWPIDAKGVERKWRYARDSLDAVLCYAQVVQRDDGPDIQLAKYQKKHPTVWVDPRYDASAHGKRLLTQMVPGADFAFPKSLHLVSDSLDAVWSDDRPQGVMDFFAGSGTTAHAVIQQCREDGRKREVVLVEMGAYFDEILLPRVVKAMCAESWKDGRAAGGTHVPSLFQVMALESYDDTMARIQTKADSSFGYGIEAHSTTPIFNHYDIGHFQLDGQSPIHWIASFNELLGLQVQETHRLPASKLMVVVGRRVHGQTVMAIWRDEICCRASEWAQQWSAVSDALSLDGVETIYVNGDVHDADPRIESLEAAFAAAQFQFEPV